MRYHQGKFRPTNASKYVGDITNVVFRSMWELHFMRYCDSNPSVVAWTSEYPIEYFSSVDNKVRRYFVDFFVKMRDAKGEDHVLMIEVKPDSQTRPPKKPKINNSKAMTRYISECETYQVNQDKWNAAEEFAARNNMRFIVMNEYDLGIAKRGN